MPGGMPYSLEKGPYFSVIEDFANGSSLRMLQSLRHLRQGLPISDLPALDSTTLDAGPYNTDQLADHVDRDWFGYVQSATGALQPQPPWDPAYNTHTGFWVEWYGDSEAVFRETLSRALELCLGLDHGENPAGTAVPRHWRLELFWRCPIPWFEGWVTWRKHGKGRRDGQVTVVVSTPSHGHPVKNTPVRTGELAAGGYALNPVTAPGDQGMWVVSQTYHRPWPKTVTEESGLGEWTFPTKGLAYVSEGAVVVVAPPEREGGITNPPRTWVPHP
ncbi:MAG: hypothetical protein ACRDZU_11900 [Acidimicrobiales bacterium]